VVVTALEAATGKRGWARTIGTTARIPTSTSTVDDDRLYALTPDGGLVCLQSASGEVCWRRDLLRDFGGRMMSGRGYGESPLVDGEKLVCTPGGPDAALVALDKRTGAVLWRAKAPDLGASGKDGAGFSSVVVTEAAGVRQYVQLFGRGLVGVAAGDGRFLWGYNAIANDVANIPTPLVRGDLVFAANGYHAGCVLLRLRPEGGPGGAAPGVQARVVYALGGDTFQNHHGGVVLVGDHVYGGHGSNNGLPTCVELMTGRVVWKARGPGVGSAAVVYADGHLYFRFQNGVVALIEASPEGYRLKGTLRVPGAGGDSWSHPVVANGRLHLREQDRLWVYDLRREPGARPPAEPTSTPPRLDASAVALRQLGIGVEPLSSARPEKARRFYGYAAGDGPAPTLLIALAGKDLTSRGTIPPPLMGALKGLRMPFVLSLAGTHVRDAGLEQLRDLDGVVGLDLGLCGDITDAGLARLQPLARLRVLVLAGTGITSAGLRKLTANKGLAALDLEVCDGVTDAACEALGEMRQLRALVLKKTGFEPHPISDAGLRHLSGLRQIEALDLYGNKVTDAGLVHLQGFSRLRELRLSLLPITDSGLARLKPLAALERLDLLHAEGFAGPTITDAGLPFLAPLRNLRALNLTGARVTDVGLESLRGLKRLSLLELVHTGATPDGIRALKGALPGCEIVR
jgi:outer membrane protein assembly factor BamB